MDEKIKITEKGTMYHKDLIIEDQLLIIER